MTLLPLVRDVGADNAVEIGVRMHAQSGAKHWREACRPRGDNPIDFRIELPLDPIGNNVAGNATQRGNRRVDTHADSRHID